MWILSNGEMQYAIYLLCDQLDEYGDDLGQEVKVLEVVEEEARAR